MFCSVGLWVQSKGCLLHSSSIHRPCRASPLRTHHFYLLVLPMYIAPHTRINRPLAGTTCVLALHTHVSLQCVMAGKQHPTAAYMYGCSCFFTCLIAWVPRAQRHVCKDLSMVEMQCSCASVLRAAHCNLAKLLCCPHIGPHACLAPRSAASEFEDMVNVRWFCGWTGNMMLSPELELISRCLLNLKQVDWW